MNIIMIVYIDDPKKFYTIIIVDEDLPIKQTRYIKLSKFIIVL